MSRDGFESFDTQPVSPHARNKSVCVERFSTGQVGYFFQSHNLILINMKQLPTRPITIISLVVVAMLIIGVFVRL